MMDSNNVQNFEFLLPINCSNIEIKIDGYIKLISDNQ